LGPGASAWPLICRNNKSLFYEMVMRERVLVNIYGISFFFLILSILFILFTDLCRVRLENALNIIKHIFAKVSAAAEKDHHSGGDGPLRDDQERHAVGGPRAGQGPGRHRSDGERAAAGPDLDRRSGRLRRQARRRQKKSAEELKKDFFVHARSDSLIRRFADPAEVADHAAYLCSPRAGATIGAAHRVEGGIVDTCF